MIYNTGNKEVGQTFLKKIIYWVLNKDHFIPIKGHFKHIIQPKP